ncbi:MAG TPA: hypothetical protein VL595_24710 [Pseudonocardia sp.]|jgi:hypothetical protein|nr:hypothetical protein [Pseudonocardia sp.]
MTQSPALLDFLHGLISDGGSRARFSADPAAALAAGGVVSTSPQDVHDALVRISDDQDLAQGFDRGSDDGRARGTDVLHVPPPPPPEYFADRDAHGAAVRYLDNYVTSNFDDDLGPFTGSSADAEGAYGAHGDPAHDYAGTDVVHDYTGHEDSAHDYSGQDYSGHDYTGQSDTGSDAGHHGGFDAGGL